MSDHQKLSGVYAAALTPINQDGSLALEDLSTLLDFLARRGCHGALLMGTTGEGPSFSPEERLSVMKAAISIRKTYPNFRLLAGTGTPSLDESIQLTRYAFVLGFDGVVVLPPYYFRKATQDGLFEWFSQLIKRAVPESGPLFAYHIPGMSGVPLPIELLQRLKDAFPQRFAGLKDSSSDAGFARQLGETFGKDLMVFSGNDALFSLALQNQASGCITAMANLFSPDLRMVWDAHINGDTKPDVQARLSGYRHVMNHYAPFPPLYKAMLPSLHGLPHWNVRPPLVPLPPETVSEILSETKTTVPVFKV
jgi:4-hydroxy-tetrahydrodipicolinate synthase